MEPFVNEPILELRRAPHRQLLLDALTELEPRLPIEVPVWIGDDRRGGDQLVSTDPGRPDRVVATSAVATLDDVEHAVRTAKEGFRAWADTPVQQRAEILVRAAQIMRERRHVLAALAVRECAKPWGEADADVCEAIDFLEYYAREAVRLEHDPPPLIQAPGERNTMRYAPRGVVAVISPWNFPLAIPTGMVSAGLAAGNAVVLKPAEQSPASAEFLWQALDAAGLPEGALNVVPGFGEVGAALVRDQR